MANSEHSLKMVTRGMREQPERAEISFGGIRSKAVVLLVIVNQSTDDDNNVDGDD